MNSKLDFKIEKLEGDNYVTWRWELINILKAKQLWEVVENAPVSPMKAKDQEKDDQAMALLGSSLGRENKMLVVGCTNSHDVWTRLESVFENKTTFEKQELLRKLHSYKIETSSDVAKHLSEIQTLASKLNILGEPITDNALTSIIFNALPAPFESFLVAFKLLAPETRTLTHLISNVIARSKEIDSNEKEASALVARHQRQSNERDQQTFKKDITCHFCKKKRSLQK